jgi:hypothetical protein
MADGANTIETLLRVLGTGLSAGRGFGSEPWGAGLMALSQVMAEKRQREEQAKLAEILFGMLPEEYQKNLEGIGVTAPGMADVLSKIVPPVVESQLRQPTVNVSLTGEDIKSSSWTDLYQRGFGGGAFVGAEGQTRPSSQTTKRLIEKEKKEEAQLKDRLIQKENDVAIKVDQKFQMGVISREKMMDVLDLMEKAGKQLEAKKLSPEEYVEFLDEIQNRLLEIPSAPPVEVQEPPQTGIRKIIPDFVEKYIPGF